MNAEKIFDLRFLSPVGILVFWFLLYSPTTFIDIIQNFKEIVWVLAITSIMIVPAIGFTISSLSVFLVRIFQFKFTRCDYDLEKIFGTTAPCRRSTSHDLASWLVLDEVTKDTDKDVATQLHKRWNMAMANFNAAQGVFWGTVSALTYTYIVSTSPVTSGPFGSFYGLFAVLLIVVFVVNGVRSMQSMYDMDRLLASRTGNLKKNETEQQ